MGDRTQDFLAEVLEIIDGAVGGIEEQSAYQIAMQIAQRFGGDQVYIRRASIIEKQWRDEQIARYVRAGNSVAQAAQKFGITRRHAYRLPTLRKPKRCDQT